MFITILIIFFFVLSIFCLTLFYNEHVDDESERQALISSIEKSKSRYDFIGQRFIQSNRKIKKKRLTKSLKK